MRKNKKHSFDYVFYGAQGETRTRTAFRPKDFKSFVATITPPGLIFFPTPTSVGIG